jgi:ribosome-binding factor A
MTKMTKPVHHPEFHINKIYKLDFYTTVVVTHVELDSQIKNSKVYFRILGEGKNDWVRYQWFNQVYQEPEHD